MFVIQRKDKEYGQFTKTHDTVEQADQEARRLIAHHIKDGRPEFAIYELKFVKLLIGEISIKEVNPDAASK